jgi:hypothetical protein
MARENVGAIPGGGSGIRARITGGISGKGGKNVTPAYKETGANVKVIKAGSKPLTPKTREALSLAEDARIAASLSRLKMFQEGRMQNWSK